MSADYTEEELGLGNIKIEKGVPRRERYPHSTFSKIAKQMEVGDSVFTKDDRVINGLSNAINKMGGAIETRTENDGRRLWRIK